MGDIYEQIYFKEITVDMLLISFVNENIHKLLLEIIRICFHINYLSYINIF